MTNTPERRARGFSLIELLIVIAIIGIVAAIAIPALLHSRQAAHSASALGSIKAIHSAEIVYRARAPQFGSLDELADAGVLPDPTLRTGNRSGYVFTINAATLGPENFELAATPNADASFHYYTNASGVIHGQLGSPADANSPAIK